MASITNTYDENNDTVFEVDPGDDTEVALATANTYVDKNIVFKLPENNFIKTVNGTEPDEDGNVEIDVENEINLIDLDEQGVSMPIFKITEFPIGLTKLYSSSSKTYNIIYIEYNLRESTTEVLTTKKVAISLNYFPNYLIIARRSTASAEYYYMTVFQNGIIRTLGNYHYISEDTWTYSTKNGIVAGGTVSDPPTHPSTGEYLNVLYDDGSGIWAPLPDFAKASDIPTLTSQLTNDSGFLTEHQSLDNYVEKEEGKGLFSYKAEDITDVGVELPQTRFTERGLDNQADFNNFINDAMFDISERVSNLYNNNVHINYINQDGTMTVEELLELESGLYYVEGLIEFYYAIPKNYNNAQSIRDIGTSSDYILNTNYIYGLIQFDNMELEDGHLQAITIYNTGMFVADYGTSDTSPHGFFKQAESLDNFGKIEYNLLGNMLDTAFEQTLRRPQSGVGEYDNGTRGQVLASTGGETPEWIDLPTQSDIEVATVEETLEYLAITIPDLSEEEF